MSYADLEPPRGSSYRPAPSGANSGLYADRQPPARGSYSTSTADTDIGTPGATAEPTFIAATTNMEDTGHGLPITTSARPTGRTATSTDAAERQSGGRSPVTYGESGDEIRRTWL